LEEMEIFAQRIQQVGRLRHLAQQACETGNFLLASLQHRAFRGEL